MSHLRGVKEDSPLEGVMETVPSISWTEMMATPSPGSGLTMDFSGCVRDTTLYMLVLLHAIYTVSSFALFKANAKNSSQLNTNIITQKIFTYMFYRLMLMDL